MVKETGSIYLVFKLIDRGLDSEKIDRSMTKMIGSDWREVNVSTWLNRFKDKGYISRHCSELSVDELEALVIGNLKCESI